MLWRPFYFRPAAPSERGSDVQIECNRERSNTRLVCKHAKFGDAIQCPSRYERESVDLKSTLGLR
jgi:hypothetical protein